MSKKGFTPIIVVSIIALLIILGIGGYLSIKNKELNKETVITPSTITTTTTSQLNQNTKASQKIDECEKIEDEYKKGNCYLNIAKAKQDPSICDKIRIEWIKDSCYWDIAVAKKDLSICDKIENQNTKGYCYSNVVTGENIAISRYFPVSPSSSITLVFPNGYERLIKGHTYKIIWKMTPPFPPAVSIDLITGDTLQAVTPEQHIIALNTGSYEWTIPDTQFMGWVLSSSGDKKTVLNDQTGFKLLIGGFPPPSMRGDGATDYSDNSFYIVSQ